MTLVMARQKNYSSLLINNALKWQHLETIGGQFISIFICMSHYLF